MANDEKKPRSMPPEEQARIMSLPIREFSFGSVMRRGHYDEEEHKFYFLNNEGALEGKVAKVTFKDQSPEDIESASKDSEVQKSTKGGKAALASFLRRVASGEKIGDGDGKTWPPGTQSTPGENKDISDPETTRKKKVLIGACIAVFIIITVIVIVPTVINGSLSYFQRPPDNASDPPQSVDSSLEEISVIQVTRDMIPGDILSEDVLQSSTISAADYNSIYLNGTPLYQWTRVSDLLLTSNYVTEYIPRGLYLTYENVSGIRPQNNNPWMPTSSSHKYVLIPLTDEIAASDKLSFGVIFDALIQITSQSNSNVPAGEDSEIDGMKISTITEKAKGYTLPDLVVCDILNEAQESIYPRYYNLMAIPSGEQLT